MAAKALTASALAVGSVLAAHAAPVLVSETLTLGQLLNGSTDSLQFDVGSALAARGLSAGQLVSGSLVVYGISDASYGATEGPLFGNYVTTNQYTYVAYYSGGCYYSSWGGGSCYYYPVYGTATEQERLGDIFHRDAVADTILVSVGGAQGSDVVNEVSASSTAYGSRVYENQVASGVNRTYYYNRTRDVYEALYGDLMVNVGLDGLAMSDLMSDSILNFSVGASVGQFRLVSATLNLRLDDAPQGVPEPGSLALVAAAAVTGAAFTRRRRKA